MIDIKDLIKETEKQRISETGSTQAKIDFISEILHFTQSFLNLKFFDLFQGYLFLGALKSNFWFLVLRFCV